MKNYLHLNAVRHLSINQFALVASAIGGIVIVSGFVLLAINAQLGNLSDTATAKATISESSLTQERAEEHAWLAQRNATIIDTKATSQRQEDLKEQWLARSASIAPEASPMQDRKEELAFLAARANVKAMVERQEELKEQWLARYTSIAPEASLMQERKEELAFLAARANAQARVERQETLKEQWLAQHIR